MFPCGTGINKRMKPSTKTRHIVFMITALGVSSRAWTQETTEVEPSTGTAEPSTGTAEPSDVEPSTGTAEPSDVEPSTGTAEATSELQSPPVLNTVPTTSPEIDLTEYTSQTFSKSQIKVSMFADIGLLLSDNFTTNEVQTGQLVFHTSANLTNGFSALTEVTLDSTPEPTATVQRLIFHWEKNDAFKLSAGRYHLPLTWWNTTAHHGLWLQTTARRPRMLDYENSFIPNHAIGVFTSGNLPVLKALGIRYNIALSGGSDDHHSHGASSTMEMDTMESADASEDTSAATLNALIALEPPAFPYLRFGVSGLLEPGVDEDAADTTRVLASHMAYTSDRPELIVEGVLVSHETGDTAHHGEHDSVTHGSVTHNSFAGYVQLAWRMQSWGGRLKPYSRFEYVQVHQSDPNLQNSSDFMGLLGGLRIDLNRSISLKFDTNWDFTQQPDSAMDANAQLSAAW
jgi:hypothetical protein